MKLYMLTGWDSEDYHELVVCRTPEEADERLRTWLAKHHILYSGHADPIDLVDGYRIIVGEKVK